MLKLKQETIDRLVEAYEEHLHTVRNDFSLSDLYGDESISGEDFEEDKSPEKPKRYKFEDEWISKIFEVFEWTKSVIHANIFFSLKNEKCLLTYTDLQTLKNILEGKVELILGEFVGGLDYQDNLKDAQLALECLRYVKMAYDRGEKNEI